MTAHFLLALALASGTVLWSEGSRRPESPLTREEVCQTIAAGLRQGGLAENQLPVPADVELPATLTAPPVRSLRVAGACWDDNRSRAQFRLECVQPGQCLPFLVRVRMDRSALAAALSHSASKQEKGTLKDQEKANAAEASDTSCASPHHPSSSTSGPRTSVPHRPLVRPGDRAEAVFRGSHLRLTAAVTCLDRGSEGDIVRVRNQDGRIFRARVSAPGLLEVVGGE